MGEERGGEAGDHQLAAALQPPHPGSPAQGGRQHEAPDRHRGRDGDHVDLLPLLADDPGPECGGGVQLGEGVAVAGPQQCGQQGGGVVILGAVPSPASLHAAPASLGALRPGGGRGEAVPGVGERRDNLRKHSHHPSSPCFISPTWTRVRAQLRRQQSSMAGPRPQLRGTSEAQLVAAQAGARECCR